MKKLLIFPLLASNYASANVIMPAFFEIFTSAKILYYHIGFVLSIILAESLIIKYFLKDNPVWRITIATIAGNLFSAAIGIALNTPVFSFIFLLPLLLLGEFIYAIIPLSIAEPIVLACAAILGFIGIIIINTILEYPAYFLGLKTQSKKSLFKIIMIANTATLIASGIYLVVCSRLYPTADISKGLPKSIQSYLYQKTNPETSNKPEAVVKSKRSKSKKQSESIKSK